MKKYSMFICILFIIIVAFQIYIINQNNQIRRELAGSLSLISQKVDILNSRIMTMQDDIDNLKIE